MHIGDNVRHPDPAKRLQAVGDQRLASHLDQRLWQGLGDWPHAGAETGSEDHG
jgi:hypothetical protein